MITLDELSKNSDWTSVLGYVCKTEGKFPPHRGLEVTSSSGEYPLVKEMIPATLEYYTQWLDNYSLDENDKLKPFVGYLKEFHEKQINGSS